MKVLLQINYRDSLTAIRKEILMPSVKNRLTNALVKSSKSDKTIANYMLIELSSLPFETAASLAGKVGVSEATVGRFCRSIGYQSLKDLKKHLKEDLGDKPWLISDRLSDFQKRAKTDEDHHLRSMELEMAALASVYETAQTPAWARVVKLLSSKTKIYATGFQTERGMAQIFVNQLQYLRDQVQLVDLAAGNFAEILASGVDSCLVIFEARNYSIMSEQLAHEARNAGIPVVLITDRFCVWGAEAADEVFMVPTEFNLFWESTAQMASLINLLVNSVFIELGPEVEQRMNKISQLYDRFSGHIDGKINIKTTNKQVDKAEDKKM